MPAADLIITTKKFGCISGSDRVCRLFPSGKKISLTDFYVFVNLFVSKSNSVKFSYSEAAEVQRTIETAATPYRTEGANLSE